MKKKKDESNKQVKILTAELTAVVGAMRWINRSPSEIFILVEIVYKHPGGSEVKASASNEGDQGLIPGSGRSPGEGNGNALQSCLENPMDGGAW